MCGHIPHMQRFAVADNIFSKSPVQIATERADTRTRGIISDQAPKAPAGVGFEDLARTTRVPTNVIEAIAEASGITDPAQLNDFTSKASGAIGQSLSSGKGMQDAMREAFGEGVDTSAILGRAVEIGKGVGSAATPAPDASAGASQSDGIGGLGGVALRGASGFVKGVGMAAEGAGRGMDAASGVGREIVSEQVGTDENGMPIMDAKRVDPREGMGAKGGRAANEYLKGKADQVAGFISKGSTEAMQGSTFKGDLFKPSTWEMPEAPSATGLAHLTADVLGSMGPVIIAALATRGSSLAGAAAGGAQSAGAGADQAREDIKALLADKDESGVSKLARESKQYQALIASGKSEEEAADIVSMAAQQLAAGWAAVPGALGGAATGAIVSRPLASLAGRGAATRIAGTAAISGAEEGLQEVAEGVASKFGLSQAAQMEVDLTADSLNNFMLGALGGGVVGGASGAMNGQKAEADPPLALPAPKRAPPPLPQGDGGAAPAGPPPQLAPPVPTGADTTAAPMPAPADATPPPVPLNGLTDQEEAELAALEAEMAGMMNVPPKPTGPVGRAAEQAPAVAPEPEALQPLARNQPKGSRVSITVPGGKPIDATFQEETDEGITFEQDGNPFFIPRAEIEAGDVQVTAVTPLSQPVAEESPVVAEVASVAAPAVIPPAHARRPQKEGAPKLQKRPLTNFMKSNNIYVDPNSPAGIELKNLGVTPQTTMGLFRNDGLKDLDNLPASEFGDFGYLIQNDDNGYLDRDALISALAEEAAGRPVQDTSQIEAQAVADYKAEMAELESQGIAVDDQGMIEIDPISEDWATVAMAPYSEMDDFDAGENYGIRMRSVLTGVEQRIGITLTPTEYYEIDARLREYGGVAEDAVWWQLRNGIEEDQTSATEQSDDGENSGPPLLEQETQGQDGAVGTDPFAEGEQRPERDAGTEGAGGAQDGNPDGAGSQTAQVGPEPALQDRWWSNLPKARHAAKQVGLTKEGIGGDAWTDLASLTEIVNGELDTIGYRALKSTQPATEQTPEGEQTLIEGVAPVTDKDRAELQAKKPKRGGDAATDFGLFDTGARDQTDMFDTPPATPSVAAPAQIPAVNPTIENIREKAAVLKGVPKDSPPDVGNISLKWDERAGGFIFSRKHTDKVEAAIAAMAPAPTGPTPPDGTPRPQVGDSGYALSDALNDLSDMKAEQASEGMVSNGRRGKDVGLRILEQQELVKRMQKQAEFDNQRKVDGERAGIKRKNEIAAKIEAEAAQVAPEPTPAQAEAGNYKKGRFSWNGMPLVIETAKGGERKGTDPDGNEWSVTMPAHYGDIKRTEGADGDPIDFYMGDNPDSNTVHIINQVDPKTGKFDEHKVILGTTSQDEALKLYRAGFSDGSGDKRMGGINSTDVSSFKGWLKDQDTKKPADLSDDLKQVVIQQVTMGLEFQKMKPDEARRLLESAGTTEPTQSRIDELVSKAGMVSGTQQGNSFALTPANSEGYEAQGIPKYDRAEALWVTTKLLEQKKIVRRGQFLFITPEFEAELNANKEARPKPAPRKSPPQIAPLDGMGPLGVKADSNQTEPLNPQPRGPRRMDWWWTNNPDLRRTALKNAGVSDLFQQIPMLSDVSKTLDGDQHEALKQAIFGPEVERQSKNEKPIKNAAPVNEGEAQESTAQNQEPVKKRAGLSEAESAELDALEAEMAAMMKGQINSGLDPKLVQIAYRMGTLYIRQGKRRFTDFIKALMDGVGLTLEQAQPIARNAYNQLRDDMDLDGQDLTGMQTSQEVLQAVRDLRAAEVKPETTPEPTPTTEPTPALKAGGQAERTKITRHFYAAFKDGKSYTTIVQARKEAAEVLGRTLTEPDLKMVEEAIEAAIVERARAIAAQDGSPKEKYGYLVALYASQPKLAQRTSTSIEQQAYSTPAPLAFLASHLVGIDQNTTIYEPSAGNGMLAISASDTNVTANELNADRYGQLRNALPGATITNADAMTVDQPGARDVVIANPPFGKVKMQDGKTVKFPISGQDGTTTEIDHAISFRALDAMKPDGKAVLIVGGHQGDADARKAKYRGAQSRKFYKKLYDTYNVTEHFTVDGRLYERQGAGWPVDVIVIDGRKPSEKVYPMKEAPTVYTNWLDFRSRLDGRTDNLDPRGQRELSGGDTDAQTGQAPDAGGVSRPAGGQDRPTGNPSAGGQSGPRGDGSSADVGERQPDTSGRPAQSGAPSGDGERDTAQQDGGARPDVADPAGSNAGQQGSNAGAPSGNAGDISGKPLPVKRKPVERDNQEAETDFQVQYAPRSGAKFAVGTLVPKNMQEAASRALDELEARVGDIDSFVADKLGYTIDEMLGTEGTQGTDGILHFGNAMDEWSAPEGESGWASYGGVQTPEGYSVEIHARAVRNVSKSSSNNSIQIRLWDDMTGDYIALWDERTTQAFDFDASISNSIYNYISSGRVDDMFGEDFDITDGDTVWSWVGEEGKVAMQAFHSALNQPTTKGTEGTQGAFSAEQVDAAALAIDNIENGKGFIIGDQTGVGKGRINAAMIRYAIRSGKLPVFVTVKPGLFGDMVRDLRDIGEKDADKYAFPTNDLRGSKAIPLSEDNPADKLMSLTKAAQGNAITALRKTSKLPKGKKVIFTTYDQMNTQKGKVTERMDAIKAIAPNAMFILDESHEAGGTAAGRTDPEGPEPRSVFIRGLLADSENGVFFSSATFAKNPAVMSLYFKTNIQLAAPDISKLEDIITQGGVPLQQIMSSSLTQDGQYLRRERTYEGISMNLEQMETDPLLAADSAKSLREIFTLDQNFMTDARESFAETYKDEGEGVASDNAVGDAGASSTNFSSIMHNAVNQVLLAIKAEAVVDKAIEAHKRGEKPIIALSNTNAAIMEDYASDEGIAIGDDFDIPFNEILRRYVQRLRRITVKIDENTKEHVNMTDMDVSIHGGEFALEELKRVEAYIDSVDFQGMPASPIDYIRDRLSAAGMNVGEVTGRGKIIKDGKYASRDSSAASNKRQMNQFNSGQMDALIINRSGATGFSLHATAKNDGKVRHMFILQPDPNIDTFMQMLGRVNRTGQIELPKYTIAVSDLAVEKRPAAVLMKKMASLNANTTASKKSAVSLDNVTDFMNKYGDEIVLDYLRENPELAALTGVAIPKNKSTADGIAAKFTGKLAILDPKQVAEIFDDIETLYTSYIQELDSMGQNGLEAKVVELDARTESRTIVSEGTELSSAFGGDTVLEDVDVKVIGKPMTLEQVADSVSKALGGQTPADHMASQIDAINEMTVLEKDKMEAMRPTLEKRLAEAKTDKQKDKAADAINRLDKRIAGFDKAVSDTKDLLHKFKVGKPVMVNVLEKGSTVDSVYGIALGVDLSKMKGNPTALGRAKVSIALASPARTLNVPLLRFAGQESQYDVMNANEATVTRAFTNGLAETREKRQIVTGNIIGGFEKFGRGQIVIYTKDDGTTGQGILMPKDFDAEKALQDQDVTFRDLDQAMQFVDTAGHRDAPALLTSEDGVLKVQRAYSGDYLMTVEKKGGKPYILSPRVREIAGDFSARSGPYNKRLNAENLKAVLKVYQETLGTVLTARTHKDEARTITGETLPDFGTQESRAPAGWGMVDPDTPPPALTNNELRSIQADVDAEIAATGLRGKVPAKVLRTVMNLAEGREVQGAYAKGRGAIQVSARSANGAVGTLRHEIIHALRDAELWGKPYGLFTAAEWKSLVRAARADKATMDRVAGLYPDLNSAQLMEENIAEQYRMWREAGGDTEAGPISKIKSFFEALANVLRGNGFNSQASVMQAIADGGVAGRGDPNPTGPGGGVSESRAPSKAAAKKAAATSKQFVSDVLTQAMAGKSGMNLLALVPGRPLIAEMGRKIPAAQTYLALKQKMDTLRNEKHADTDKLAQRWRKLIGADGKSNTALMDIMHDSTIAGIDPTLPHNPITLTTDEATVRNGDPSTYGYKAANYRLRKEAKRQRDYDDLKERFDALPKAYRDMYRDVRDGYDKIDRDFQEAIVANAAKAMEVTKRRAERAHAERMQEIDDEGLTGKVRDDAIADADAELATVVKKGGWGNLARLRQLRQRFESNKLQGPYFPLSRFGQFQVTVRDKNKKVVSFSLFESARKQRQAAEELRAQGYDVETGVLTTKTMRDAVDPAFVADITGLLDGIDADSAIMDAIWQRWLMTLPDMSMRKTKIHRKGTPGFSGDAFRAYGNHMFHSAHQLARLTYSLDMEEALTVAKAEAARDSDPVRSGLVVDEINKRHEYTMNPKGAAWSQAATSAAFVYYLGMTPAAALVNMTQTVVVGIPVLGAFHGKGGQAKAAAALTKAAADFTRADKLHLTESKHITANEKAAMNTAYDIGAIDRSQSHDLAGIGDSGVEYSAIRTKVMGVISYMFHHAERANREITFLAAYRMAKEKGMDQDAAVKAASDLTWKTHFDYQNTSRPRLMQNDTARVALVFKNFQINMLWRLFRDTHQAINAENQAVKDEARRQLVGITAQMMLNAGIKGTWGYSLLMMFAGMFFAGGGDEAEKEMEKALSAYLPRPVVGAMLNGVPGQALGIDLRSRIGMPDLWFRSSDRELEGEDEYTYWIMQLLGAVPGMAVRILKGADTLAEGVGEGDASKAYRGVETMVPKFIRDPMRAGRYAVDGAETYNGDPIIDTFGTGEIIGQAIGFTPARLSERYDANTRMKNEEKRIMKERSGIMKEAAKSVMKGRGLPESVVGKVKDFNERVPEYPITSKSLKQSIGGRERASVRNEFGIQLNPKLNDRIRDDAAPLLSGK
jgi:hypothetical protein